MMVHAVGLAVVGGMGWMVWDLVQTYRGNRR